jgi:hypothetical protein
MYDDGVIALANSVNALCDDLAIQHEVGINLIDVLSPGSLDSMVELSGSLRAPGVDVGREFSRDLLSAVDAVVVNDY